PRDVSTRTPRPCRPRRGVVLVAVLALLALGAALIAGAFAAARASARASRSARAAIVAQAATRRGLARAMTSWSATEDSLGIGAYDTRVYADAAVVAPDSADVRVRVHRLSTTLYVVAAEARVPATGASLARRRARVLLERAPTIDSSIVQPIRPIARWASADLY
ncbi:MAG TPA: hypothetical protein VJT85_04980, partial [Gemmatimonadaceae bacterium]|nr:hypothetical protein [Gemmatimonadaceae bacterium]